MKKKVLKNYIYNLSLKVFMVLAPFITAPYLARVLHPEGIGIFSYTTSITSAFGLFAWLGFANYGQREVAYLQDNLSARSKLFFELIVLRAITTFIVLAVYIPFCFAYKQYTNYFLILSATIAIIAIDISWYFVGIEDFGTVVVRDILIKLASIACIFLFVKTEADLDIFIIINVATAFLGTLIFYVRLNRYVDLKAYRQIEIKNFWSHFLGSLSFFIPIISVELYSHFDKIMLGWLLDGTVESGYYEQARKILVVAVPLVVSLNSVLLSRIANHYAKGEKQEIIKWYKSSFNVILLLIFPMMVGLFLVADNFTLWFYGAEYAKVAQLLKISCPMFFFMCIGNFVGVQYMSPTGNQNKMTFAYLTAALINFVLNLILIPKLLSIGALLASLVAEIVSCSILIFYLKKSEFNFPMFHDAWRYITASLIMGAVIIFFHNILPLSGISSSLFDVSVGALVYFAVLILVKETIVTKVLGTICSKVKG